MAHLLMSIEATKHSIEEYLMFFRHYTKRSAVQWQAVLRRTYPWFQPGYRLFEKEPEEEEERIEFRKKFLSVMLPWDVPFGRGKPPNYHLGAEVYHSNFCAWQLGCPQLIPLKSYRSCNCATSWRDSDDLDVHKDCRCSWKARFQGFAASSIKVLFDGWDSWIVYVGAEAKRFMVQMIKDINAQVIEDPSVTQDIGSQTLHSGEEEILAEVIAESIALAKQQEEAQRADPTSSELALFDDVEAEHSAATPELEVEAEHFVVVLVPEVTENKTAGVLVVVTNPFKPLIVAMPIHSLPSSSTTASFANPELAEFEAMDLDAQLDKLEKLSFTLGKAKSKVVDKAVDRVKIWMKTKKLLTN
ncbi:unnamed protein product [Prunus armeniaca]